MVTIVVPVYNSESFLKECLDSIACQTYQDIEVIIIDDGSQDDSGKIAEEFADKDLRFSVVHQDNHGLVYSRKQGVSRSRGEALLFVDSDDWIDKDMVSDLVALLKDNNADVVASGVRTWYKNEYTESGNAADSGIYSGEELEVFKNKLFCYRDYSTMALLPFLWNKMWKTDAIKTFVENADEGMTIGEDVAIGFPAILNSKCVVVTNNAYYNYRKTSDSMLNTVKDEKRELDNIKRVAMTLDKYCTRISNQRYLMNQLLTRCYSEVSKGVESGGLYPFMNKMPNEIVLYGAGEFGKAIFDYVCGKSKVKSWIDKNAEILRKNGYEVVNLDEVTADSNDMVVVAVLDAILIETIVRQLLIKGYKEENIKVFAIGDHEEKQLIHKMIDEKIYY